MINNPKFNNALIAAGGAASGKGFVLKNVLLFQGKTFDIDDLKTKIIKSKENSIIRKEFEKFAKEKNYKKTKVSELDLKDPEDVTILHFFTIKTGYDDKFKDLFFKVAANTEYKPNVIFDVTLKKIDILNDYIEPYLKMGNYDPKNVHLVWILNSFDIAVKQNFERERSVSMDIMMQTHEGAALTMKSILKNAEQIRNVVDGDIWIVPNQIGIDSSTIENDDIEINWKGKTYKRNIQKINDKESNLNLLGKNKKIITKYSAICIKKSGKPAMKYEEIKKDLIDKIRDYIPKKYANIFD